MCDRKIDDSFDWVICDSPAGIEKGASLAMRFADAAQTAKDNQAKAVLLHMAQVWFRLAAEHAKHAKGG
jgi:septum formation inhibitor-activating ATPase MinD